MARSTRSNVSESPAAPSPAEGPPQSSRGAFSSGGKRAAAGAAAAQDTPSKRQRVKAKAVSKVPATPPTGAKRTKTSPRLASVVKKLVLAGDDLRDVPRTVSASNFYGKVQDAPFLVEHNGVLMRGQTVREVKELESKIEEVEESIASHEAKLSVQEAKMAKANKAADKDDYDAVAVKEKAQKKRDVGTKTLQKQKADLVKLKAGLEELRENCDSVFAPKDGVPMQIGLSSRAPGLNTSGDMPRSSSSCLVPKVFAARPYNQAGGNAQERLQRKVERNVMDNDYNGSSWSTDKIE
ncbi:hypothetical protein T484DRAFT_1894093 [Baffinella frigidus]|nr:hypothetical protein T484DRAFT_1894093 [Cryptophyta sp. CCMP2293]